MSVFTRKECDGCHQQVRLDDPVLGGWYSLYRNNPHQFRDAGDSDRFDFCSLPCVIVWAQRNRELPPVRVIRQPLAAETPIVRSTA